MAGMSSKRLQKELAKVGHRGTACTEHFDLMIASLDLLIVLSVDN